MRERDREREFDGGYVGDGLPPGDKAIGPLNYIKRD
jgi:hypothetical protein